MADWSTGYDPLNMNDPNHPFARLGAELARQQGGQRRSLADQLGGYPQQQRIPQQSSRLASMLGQPMQQQSPMPMGQMPQALAALFGQQRFGSGASVSAPMQNWDQAKPDPTMPSSGLGGWLQGLFSSNGAAKG